MRISWQILWVTNNLVFHFISRVAHNNWIVADYTPLDRAFEHLQRTVLIHLGYINSCCNFLLYILTGPSFRKQFIETFCKKRNYIRDHNWISAYYHRILIFLIQNNCLTTRDLQENYSTGIQCSKVLVFTHFGLWNFYTNTFEFLPLNTKLLDMSDMRNQRILQQQKKYVQWLSNTGSRV